MFSHNKYHKWYFNIVNAAKTRLTPIGYIEKHHIIPRSLGGDNSPSNLVQLTAREHFICHLLLVRFTFGPAKSKMAYAVRRMMNSKGNRFQTEKYLPPSIVYEIHRKSVNLYFKSNPQPLSDAARKKLSEALTGRVFSAETKAKMSAAKKAFQNLPR